MESAVIKSAVGGVILLALGFALDRSTLIWIGFGVLLGAIIRLAYTEYFVGTNKS